MIEHIKDGKQMEIQDNIKLICCDVDGTLVTEGSGSLPEGYCEIIHRLKQKGIIFAACSGRQIISLEKLFAAIGEDTWYIAENGAYIGTYQKNLDASILNQIAYPKLIQSIEAMPEVIDFMISAITRLL